MTAPSKTKKKKKMLVEVLQQHEFDLKTWKVRLSQERKIQLQMLQRFAMETGQFHARIMELKAGAETRCIELDADWPIMKAIRAPTATAIDISTTLEVKKSKKNKRKKKALMMMTIKKKMKKHPAKKYIMQAKKKKKMNTVVHSKKRVHVRCEDEEDGVTLTNKRLHVMEGGEGELLGSGMLALESAGEEREVVTPACWGDEECGNDAVEAVDVEELRENVTPAMGEDHILEKKKKTKKNRNEEAAEDASREEGELVHDSENMLQKNWSVVLLPKTFKIFCPYCAKGTNRAYDLKRHIQKHHPEHMMHAEEGGQEGNIVGYGDGREWESGSDLVDVRVEEVVVCKKTHQKNPSTVLMSKTFKLYCQYCGRGTNRPYDLNRHIKTYHQRNVAHEGEGDRIEEEVGENHNENGVVNEKGCVAREELDRWNELDIKYTPFCVPLSC